MATKLAAMLDFPKIRITLKNVEKCPTFVIQPDLIIYCSFSIWRGRGIFNFH